MNNPDHYKNFRALSLEAWEDVQKYSSVFLASDCAHGVYIDFIAERFGDEQYQRLVRFLNTKVLIEKNTAASEVWKQMLAQQETCNMLGCISLQRDPLYVGMPTPVASSGNDGNGKHEKMHVAPKIFGLLGSKECVLYGGRDKSCRPFGAGGYCEVTFRAGRRFPLYIMMEIYQLLTRAEGRAANVHIGCGEVRILKHNGFPHENDRVGWQQVGLVPARWGVDISAL